MNTYLIMIEIVTFNKEFRNYFLLKSRDIKDAQAAIDAYLRQNGNTNRDFDYSMTSVEKLDDKEATVFKKYFTTNSLYLLL